MTEITFEIDSELKEQAEKLFEELGLTFSEAISIFCAKCVREQAIPFYISLKPYPNRETLAAIEETNQLKNDPNKKCYNDFDEVLKELEIEEI